MLNVPYPGRGFYVSDFSLSGCIQFLQERRMHPGHFACAECPKSFSCTEDLRRHSRSTGHRIPLAVFGQHESAISLVDLSVAVRKEKEREVLNYTIIRIPYQFSMKYHFFSCSVFLRCQLQALSWNINTKKRPFFFVKSDFPFWLEGIGEWYEQLNFKFRSGGVGRTGQNDPGREQEIGGQVVTRYVYFWMLSVWQYDYICMYIFGIYKYIYICVYIYMRHTRCTTVTFWENVATAIETHQLCRKSHENNTVLPLKQQLLISNSSWCETSESWIVDFVGSRRPRNSWEKASHNVTIRILRFVCFPLFPVSLCFLFRFSRILVQEISKQPRILIGLGG